MWGKDLRIRSCLLCFSVDSQAVNNDLHYTNDENCIDDLSVSMD